MLEIRKNILKPTFIIDGIQNINRFMYFKSIIFRLLSLSFSFDTVNFILISNFDITKSEIRSLFNFGQFLAL